MSKITQKFQLVTLVILFLVQYVMCSEDETMSEDQIEATEDLKFKYLFFREDCYDEFWRFNFFYEDCFSVTLSKGLGYGVILGACAIKFPQIIRIAWYRSGNGIVPSMYYMECLMYIIVGCYNIHIDSPFSVYGENIFLLVQSSIIISLLWMFETSSTKLEKLFVSCGIACFFLYLMVDAFVPELLWKILMNCQFLMLSYARMPQIIQNCKNRSTGQLSFITFSIGFCGNCARLFTVLKEVTDIFYIITCILTTLYNFILSVQIVMFWKNKLPKDAQTISEKDSENSEIQLPESKNIGQAEELTDDNSEGMDQLDEKTFDDEV